MDLEIGKTKGAGAGKQRPLTWRTPMRRAFALIPDRLATSGLVLLGVSIALATTGCRRRPAVEFAAESKLPTMQQVHPQVRNIVRTVGQPSFIEAFERTPIYPKPNGYIERWRVDIGDKVKKGELLAKLFVPEVVEEHGTKRATVVLDRERIALAKEMVQVATADVKAAEERLHEARAILDKYEAEVERWDTQVKRLQREVDAGVVDPQILFESNNQLEASTAARDQAKATIKRAEAELLSRRAALEKAEVDVRVAEADLKVADSEEKRLQALEDYLILPAPYDGIITARNANTWDFVLPTTGDPTSDSDARTYHLSPSKGAAPIYVVARTDKVRIFIDIPEEDANYVHVGTRASVLVKGYRDEPFPGAVTRTAWALNPKSYTLRAEIDLPNPDSRLLPGMYAFAKVIIERDHVLALPVEALTYTNDQAFCWLHRKGHAIRAEVRTGVSDGDYMEVTSLLDLSQPGADEWVPFTGEEEVLLGDLTLLADGIPVQLTTADRVARNDQGTPPAAARAREGSGPRPVHPAHRTPIGSSYMPVRPPGSPVEAANEAVPKGKSKM